MRQQKSMEHCGITSEMKAKPTHVCFMETPCLVTLCCAELCFIHVPGSLSRSQCLFKSVTTL